MKTIKLSCLLLLTILIASCANEETQSIKVNGYYEIELPKSLSKANNLNEDASLQYQNLFTEFYTIVIDEPITDFNDLFNQDEYVMENYTPDLTGYCNLLKDNLSITVENGTFSNLKDTKINGMEAKLMNVTGTVDGFDVYYQFGFVKGKKRYYQIVNWTELKRKEDHAESMQKIIASFKELNRSKKKIQ